MRSRIRPRGSLHSRQSGPPQVPARVRYEPAKAGAINHAPTPSQEFSLQSNRATIHGARVGESGGIFTALRIGAVLLALRFAVRAG